MNTEDLFKYGVTPKEGVAKGKRLEVLRIEAGKIVVLDEDGKEHSMKHGTYDIWREPKTLFEDSSIRSTWGNLRKAVENAGLGDDTLLAVPDFIIGFREADIRKEELLDKQGHVKTYIIVK